MEKIKITITRTGGYPMGAGILLTTILLFTSQLSFAGSTVNQGTLDIDLSIEKLDNINYLPSPHFSPGGVEYL